MVGRANRAAMGEAANARGSHAKPVVPSVFAKCSIVRKPSIVLKLAVCAQDQEFIQC